MKFRRTIRIILGVTLSISVLSVVYAIYNIMDINNSIEESIQTWEEQKNLQGLSSISQDLSTQSISSDSKVTKDNPDTSLSQNIDIILQMEKYNIKLIGQLVFRRTDDKIPLVQGAELTHLRFGAGLFPKSVSPGQKGNSIILGHKENVFRNLGELKLNDEIIIETLDKTYVYKIVETKIVDRVEDDILDPIDKQRITLITCYPIRDAGPADQRYLVIGEMKL